MGDRYVKSHENEKILYIDAINIYGWPMSESLPCDDIEMWHGHPDLYMNKLEEIINTSDDSDIGYSLQVEVRCPDNTKKFKKIPFCPKKLFIKINIKII